MKHPIAPHRFERLVRDHHASVYRSAVRVLRTSDQASDVAQSVFLKLLSGEIVLEEAREEAAVLRWWAVRMALAQLRAETARRSREDGYAMQRGTQDEFSDPAHTTEESERRRAVSRELDALQDELRVPLALRFLEGLTFKAIAGMLDCSEPTAHDRVRRGLERLRVRLSSSGLTATLALLESDLRVEASCEIPPALEGELIALGDSVPPSSGVDSTNRPEPMSAGSELVGGTPTGAFASLAVGLVGMGALVFVALSAGRSGSGTEERLAALAPAGDASQPAPLVELGEVGAGRVAESEAGATSDVGRTREPDTAPVQSRQGALVRGVLTSSTGPPIAGLRVNLEGVRQKGPGDEITSVATGPDGSFELRAASEALALHGKFRVRAMQASNVVLFGDTIELVEGKTVDLGALVIPSDRIDVPGNWSLFVRVTTDLEKPLPDVIVRVFRRVANAHRAEHTVAEIQAATDDRGVVELAGDLLGRKLIAIDARSRGYRFQRDEFTIAHAGHSERPQRLRAGVEISGVVRCLDGELPRRVDVQAFHEPSTLRTRTTTDELGQFTLRGLEPVEHTLRASSGGYSPSQIAEVAPGSRDVVIELKRREDPSSGVSRMAEIHGRYVDRETGDGIELDVWSTRIEALPSTSSAGLLADVLPNRVFPRPVQQMLSSEPPAPSPEFHLTGLQAGRYAVFVHGTRETAPAFAAPIELAQGEIAAGVLIRSSIGYRVEGTVRTGSGRPVPGAWILLTGTGTQSDARIEEVRKVRAADPDARHWQAGLLRADEKGRFRTPWIPGELNFRIVAFDKAGDTGIRALEPPTRSGETREVTLVIERE